MTPEYLEGCHRPYERRAARYRLAAAWMIFNGLDDDSRVVDLGAGRMEMERCLRDEFGWNGRYVPVDHAHDGTDLADFAYPEADFYVALEVLEHLPKPTLWRVIDGMNEAARVGMVITTPNPDVQNVLDMDETHINPIPRGQLELMGFDVQEVMLYDGYYSGGKRDGLLATKKGTA